VASGGQAAAYGAGDLKKSHALLCHRGEWRYACIADHQQTWPGVVLGEVLGVGRSGFDDDQGRQRAPARRGAESALLERLKALAEKTRHRYGSRRLATQLQEEGDAGGRFQVRRLMKQAGVSVAGRCRRRPPTTESRQG
jgi:HTH-like domain